MSMAMLELGQLARDHAGLLNLEQGNQAFIERVTIRPNIPYVGH
jgi:hypothetical protein